MKEWLYGSNAVYEALKAGRRRFYRLWLAQGVEEKGRLIEILNDCQCKNIPVERVSRQRLDSISDGNQGVGLESSGYPYSSLVDILEMAGNRGEPPLVLLLDTLQDPQNLGTLLRTAENIGVHGVLLPLRHTATVTPAVVNASSGASEHLLVGQTNLAQAIGALKVENVWVIGLESRPEALLPGQLNLSGPVAIVVGGEGAGIRPLVRSSCDFLLRLPMLGKIESMNAAVAGSIALYLARQARGFD